jgi:hypothetical protein
MTAERANSTCHSVWYASAGGERGGVAFDELVAGDDAIEQHGSSSCVGPAAALPAHGVRGTGAVAVPGRSRAGRRKASA